ncbi:putative bifunctional diguanylate cyclase/phosphodiesterase [Azohydromonas caseinilytica]|uniref:EAL domain-containing protein n=1 Tax=Azohydromonas caseinilytica TaxID=2728836 RepID=A0A848F2Z4_9BURK|nr:EAL domain-containing protein [Azohydromonas caseinilytica]NML13772.1 EAL domain-containing protein [Azohydromonas caseinilytica]
MTGGLLLRRSGDTLLACIAMLMVVLLLGLFEFVQLDTRHREALRTQAELVARTAAAAVVFEDSAEALALLEAFKAAPAVASAQLQRHNGQALAQFRRDEPPQWLERQGGRVFTEVPVLSSGIAVGRLQVQAYQAPVWRALATVLGAAVLIMVLSLGVVMLGSWRQRAQLREADARTRYLAHHDVLTGLANRERFAAALAEAAATGLPAVLMCVDVDDFKLVNDSRGHAAGDVVLRTVAQRLQRLVRPQDVVGRLGGDEFAVLLCAPVDEQVADAVAQRIVEQLPRRIEYQGASLKIGVSLGVALLPEDAGTADEAMACADMAMYQAKHGGKGTWSRYTATLGEAHRERRALEQALRAALARQEFELAYQPVFDAQGRLKALEGLARWHSPQRGSVPPAQFIPVLEEAGLVGELGLELMQQLRRDIDAWTDQGLRCPPVALNLSSHQCRLETQRERFLQQLDRLNLTPQEVEFELTETTVFEDLDSPDSIVRALQARGYALAIDDFGTGYSSLAYLLRLRCAKLKIDRVFVDGLARREDAALLVETMVRVAHAMDMRVVAEGVERVEDQQRLVALGCDLYQGFLLAHPLPAQRLGPLLRAGGVAPPVASIGLDARVAPAPAPARGAPAEMA